ncbi:MAG: aminoacyl-tRNA hydrolase [Christensenellales bacterium]
MKLIIGLGNPGERYQGSRHNMGFEVIDRLGDKLRMQRAKTRKNALVSEGVYRGERLALCKPLTYMNCSGEAVRDLCHWYKVEPEDALIISDDVDLPVGTIRLRPHGGAGTHNGWRSIIQETGSDRFPRIRIGVGSPPPEWDLANWVLAGFQSPEEKKIIEDALNRACDAALEFLGSGIEKAMNVYNRTNEPTAKTDTKT